MLMLGMCTSADRARVHVNVSLPDSVFLHVFEVLGCLAIIMLYHIRGGTLDSESGARDPAFFTDF